MAGAPGAAAPGDQVESAVDFIWPRTVEQLAGGEPAADGGRAEQYFEPVAGKANIVVDDQDEFGSGSSNADVDGVREACVFGEGNAS